MKYLYIAEGVFLCCLAWFGYLWAKKGWAWGVAKLKAWWNAGAADIASVKNDIETLKTDVEGLKKKVGV